MYRQTTFALLLTLATSLAACGGSSTPSTPTTPTPPTPQANRAPVISSVTATPSFGVQDFGLYTFNAAATDADNDTLTYAWSLAGNSRTGATAQIGPFVNGGTFTATVTVTDGKGGSASSDLAFVVTTMTGNWTGSTNSASLATFGMGLTQVAGLFSGTITTQQGTGTVGPTGALATIDANGRVTMRIKVAPFQDFTMTGQMDSTGRRVTGSMSGSGFNGQTFILTK